MKAFKSVLFSVHSRLRPLGAACWLVIGLGLSCATLLSACGGGRPEAQGEQAGRNQSLSAPGWHLLTNLDARDLKELMSLPDARLAVFEGVHASGDTEPAFKHHPTLTEVMVGRTVWVYVAKEGEAIDFAQLQPPHDEGDFASMEPRAVSAYRDSPMSSVDGKAVASETETGVLRAPPDGDALLFEPLPPSGLVASAESGRVHLRWVGPQRFIDGRVLPENLSFRIYQNEVPVADSSAWTYAADMPQAGKSHTYFVTSVLKLSGREFESDRSSIVELDVDDLRGPPRGTFGAPSNVGVGEGVRLPAVPKVGFGTLGDATYTHLVYVAKGAAPRTDEVHYQRSLAFARSGSFAEAAPLVEAPASWVITEATLAAHGARLVVGWIETQGDGAKSRIRIIESLAAGEVGSFSAPRTLRKDVRGLRSLDMAFDHLGRHHLIWSEANKVYYALDFEVDADPHGVWVNVFDEHKRWINHEEVRYWQVTQGDDCGDACCTDGYEDAYSLGHELDPRTQKPKGPYLKRTEETYVENPSLHVDGDKVTIIARQTRMFDNYPYRNPDWQGAHVSFFGPLIAVGQGDAPGSSGQGCALQGAMRYQMGFQWAQAKSPYACLPTIPQDALLLMQADEDHAQTADWGKNDFYAYDGQRGHPLFWYQRRFEGMWFEDDQIKVAQRPLHPGAWSRPETVSRSVPEVVDAKLVVMAVEESVEQGWRRGVWKREAFDREPVPGERVQFEEAFQNWRISTVDRFLSERAGDYTRCHEGQNEAMGAFGPSYASVYTAPGGRMVTVYEKGTSKNPNEPTGNPLYVAISEDGGVHWSVPDEPMAYGYLPSLGIAQRGEVGVVYYQPESETTAAKEVAASGNLRAVSDQGQDSGRIVVARSPDGKAFTHEVLNQLPGDSSAPGALMPAYPIHPRVYGTEADAFLGVPTLATYGDFWLAAWVGAPAGPAEKPTIALARASGGPIQQKSVVAWVPEAVTAQESFKATLACVDEHQVLTRGCATQTMTFRAGGRAFSGLAGLTGSGTNTLNGQKTVWLGGTTANAPLLSLAPAAAFTVFDGLSPDAQLAEGPASVVASSAPESTISLQPTEVIAPDVHGNHQRATDLLDALYRPGIQREYLAVEGNEDNDYLVRYGRAWAYTQGIALAQHARHGDDRAIALAQNICDSAVVSEGGTAIKGWPFSRNTEEDTWEDARLVTGANAWVVHGLGVFMVSGPFGALSEGDQAFYADCYGRALLGLSFHRAGVVFDGLLSENASAQWLMTAGTTTEGLQAAPAPHRLGLTEDPKLEFAYYDILDIIGYDTFRPDLEPTIKTFYRDTNGDKIPETESERRLVEGDEDVFDRLRRPAVAKNVVTEHNLDTLSVLNHARHHWGTLSPHLPESVVAELGGFEGLTTWRDGLKEAIFTELWHETDGRVVTGGGIDGGAFAANEHTAIDNCSWLAISVDYEALTPIEQHKLVRCLHYTIDVFVKPDLTFNKVKYRGAFYFPNSFKDPYIEANSDNERLYHLEATAGLILGLVTFVDALKDAFPEDTIRFEQEATQLWASMQRFLADNGVPYSSIRIQDVMTELPSATAAIWFIDVYDYYEARQQDLDRPLKHYARAESLARVGQWAARRLQSSTAALWQRDGDSPANAPRSGNRVRAVRALRASRPAAYPLAAAGAFTHEAWYRLRQNEYQGANNRSLVVRRSRTDVPALHQGTAFLGQEETKQVVRLRQLVDGTDAKTGIVHNPDRLQGVDARLGDGQFDYAPVNWTSVRAEVAFSEPPISALSPVAYENLSVTGRIDDQFISGPSSEYYVLLSHVNGLDQKEHLLAAASVDEDGTFGWSKDAFYVFGLGTPNQDTLVMRLFERGGHGPHGQDRMIAVTGSALPIVKDKLYDWRSGEWGSIEDSRTYVATLEGSRGAWYFHQDPAIGAPSPTHALLTGYDPQSATVAQVSLRTHLSSRLLVSEKRSVGSERVGSCEAMGGSCLALSGAEDGCRTEALWPVEAVCPADGDGRGTLCCGPADLRNEQSITFLEDQALAILAALSRRDSEMAAAWVEGLLATAQVSEEDGVRRTEFPYVVDSGRARALSAYYQTGAQMLALYALGAYLKEPRGGHPDARPNARRIWAWDVLQDVLSTLLDRYQKEGQNWLFSGSGDPQALARVLADPVAVRAPGPLDADGMQPVFEMGSLSDQVYAFFAIDMALAVARDRETKDPAWVSRLTAVRQGLQEALAVDFQDDGRLNPFVGVHAPPGGWGDRLDVHVLYTLYSFAQGDPVGGRAAWDRVISIVAAGGPLQSVSLAEDGDSSSPPPAPLAPNQGVSPFANGKTAVRLPNVAGSLAGALLAKRAASVLDPRLEELALNDFGHIAEMAGSTRDFAGLLLAEDPNGFLGVTTGSLLGQNSFALQSLAFSSPTYLRDYEPIMHARLQDRYFDALFSLLASEYKPYVFDVLLRRLTMVEFAVGAVEDRSRTTVWAAEYEALFEPTLFATVDRLKNLCDLGYPGISAIPPATHPIQVALGLSCEDTSAQFVRLLKQRIGGLSTPDLASVLDHPHDALDMTAFSRALHAVGKEEGVYDRDDPNFLAGSLFWGQLTGPVRTHVLKKRSTEVLAQYGRMLPLLSFSPEVKAEDVSQALRTRLTEILENAVLDASSSGQTVFFERAGIDFVSLANDRSWDHVSRIHTEYQTLDEGVSTLQPTLLGRSIPIPGGAAPKRALDALAGPPVEPGVGRAEIQENVRLLRHFLNQEAKGDLPAAAALAGFTADELHRMMASGKVRQAEFAELAEGLGLSQDAIESWMPRWTFLPADSATYRVEVLKEPIEILDVHQGLLGPVGALAVASPGNPFTDTELSLVEAPKSTGGAPFQLLADGVTILEAGGRCLSEAYGAETVWEGDTCVAASVIPGLDLTDLPYQGQLDLSVPGFSASSVQLEVQTFVEADERIAFTAEILACASKEVACDAPEVDRFAMAQNLLSWLALDTVQGVVNSGMAQQGLIDQQGASGRFVMTNAILLGSIVIQDALILVGRYGSLEGKIAMIAVPWVVGAIAYKALRPRALPRLTNALAIAFLSTLGGSMVNLVFSGLMAEVPEEDHPEFEVRRVGETGVSLSASIPKNFLDHLEAKIASSVGISQPTNAAFAMTDSPAPWPSSSGGLSTRIPASVQAIKDTRTVGSVDDSVLTGVLRTLISEGVLSTPAESAVPDAPFATPDWTHTLLDFWTEASITDDEFVDAMQYLLTTRAIDVGSGAEPALMPEPKLLEEPSTPEPFPVKLSMGLSPVFEIDPACDEAPGSAGLIEGWTECVSADLLPGFDPDRMPYRTQFDLLLPWLSIGGAQLELDTYTDSDGRITFSGRVRPCDPSVTACDAPALDQGLLAQKLLQLSALSLWDFADSPMTQKFPELEQGITGNSRLVLPSMLVLVQVVYNAWVWINPNRSTFTKAVYSTFPWIVGVLMARNKLRPFGRPGVDAILGAALFTVVGVNVADFGLDLAGYFDVPEEDIPSISLRSGPDDVVSFSVSFAREIRWPDHVPNEPLLDETTRAAFVQKLNQAEESSTPEPLPVKLSMGISPVFEIEPACDEATGSAGVIEGWTACVSADLLPGFDPDQMPYHTRFDFSLPWLDVEDAQLEVDTYAESDGQITFSGRLRPCDPGASACAAPALDQGLLAQKLLQLSALSLWDFADSPMTQKFPEFEQGAGGILNSVMPAVRVVFLAVYNVFIWQLDRPTFVKVAYSALPFIVGLVAARNKLRPIGRSGLNRILFAAALTAMGLGATDYGLQASGYFDVPKEVPKEDIPSISLIAGPDDVVSFSVSLPTEILWDGLVPNELLLDETTRSEFGQKLNQPEPY